MAERIPQSTSYELAFKAFLTTTGAEATSKTIAMTISKNGATSFGAMNTATNATEIANGWYFVVLDTTDTGTLGRLAVRGTSAGCNDVGIALTVVEAAGMGATNLNASISSRQADIPNLDKTTAAIGRGTVTTGGSTTSVPTSAFTPAGAVADQFKNRVIIFDADTTTTALRGQTATISASSNAATPTFTVTALTTAPVSGDTFSVI